MNGRWGHRAASIRVGEFGTLQAMLMTPSAIAAELARIDLAMRAFATDMASALAAHGIDTAAAVTPSASGASDDGPGLASRVIGFLTGTSGLAEAAEASKRFAASGNMTDVYQYITSIAKTAASTNPIVKFIHDQWLPFLATWQTFYAQEKDGAWFHNAAYDGEKYLDQLVQLRRSAKALGIPLASSEPSGEHDDLGITGLLKIGLYGAIGIGGIWAVSQVVQASRK